MPVALAQTYQPTAELFTAFEVSDSVYVGGSTALGKGLYEPVQASPVGSFGRYHYDGTQLTVPTTFDGLDVFHAALAGYQLRKGALITKLFAGIEAEDQ